MAALSTPATTQPTQNSAKIGTAWALARTAAPLSSSSAVAHSKPMADRASPEGSAPGPQDQSTAARSTPMAARGQAASRAACRAGRAVGGVPSAATAAKPPHSASASAWFRKVGEGETL